MLNIYFLSKVTEFPNKLFLFFKHLNVLAKYQIQYMHTVYWLRILSFNLNTLYHKVEPTKIYNVTRVYSLSFVFFIYL